ncbi:MAG: acyl-ACP--UDP-N-acetylglucosamine O-acyltransferase [Candidatus Korobacteraceae bacterium]
MIHPTAIVDPAAKVPESCEIGPYCVVGPGVELGERCRLISHVNMEGPTRVGKNNVFYPFGAIGMAPQDITYAGEPTRLEMGDDNQVREAVTLNRGTVKGGGVTCIGSRTLIMAYSHVGHDCQIGDDVMLVNGATLAGHVTVEDWAVVGALNAVHQFVRIGAHSYIGGGTVITQDVLPFSKTSAVREVHAYGVNSVGLQRRGFSEERVRKLQRAFRVLLAAKLNTTQALERLKADPDVSPDVKVLIRFIEASERGVLK